MAYNRNYGNQGTMEIGDNVIPANLDRKFILIHKIYTICNKLGMIETEQNLENLKDEIRILEILLQLKLQNSYLLGELKELNDGYLEAKKEAIRKKDSNTYTMIEKEFIFKKFSLLFRLYQEDVEEYDVTDIVGTEENVAQAIAEKEEEEKLLEELKKQKYDKFKDNKNKKNKNDSHNKKHNGSTNNEPSKKK